jgi:Pyruvate/2-oxoacid:ferredoxin oxidoreductase gamma subunit
MEHEILFTGIGGQGIQLMAKVLAQAVADGGRHAMLFGVYHGAMRGGPSDTTLVVGDGPIEAPPIVPACASIVAMHPRSLDVLLPKLRAGGTLYANETLVPPRAAPATVAVPATRLAEEAGASMGAGMIMLGAFVAHTGLAPLDRVVAAMRASLPSHRARQADANAALLARGAAWIDEARAARPGAA